jgi:hypothetical protein
MRTVDDIVAHHLKEGGFDGLYKLDAYHLCDYAEDSTMCQCKLDNGMLDCWGSPSDCIPGFLIACTSAERHDRECGESEYCLGTKDQPCSRLDREGRAVMTREQFTAHPYTQQALQETRDRWTIIRDLMEDGHVDDAIDYWEQTDCTMCQVHSKLVSGDDVDAWNELCEETCTLGDGTDNCCGGYAIWKQGWNYPNFRHQDPNLMLWGAKLIVASCNQHIVRD